MAAEDADARRAGSSPARRREPALAYPERRSPRLEGICRIAEGDAGAFSAASGAADRRAKDGYPTGHVQTNKRAGPVGGDDLPRRPLHDVGLALAADTARKGCSARASAVRVRVDRSIWQLRHVAYSVNIRQSCYAVDQHAHGVRLERDDDEPRCGSGGGRLSTDGHRAVGRGRGVEEGLSRGETT